MGRLLLNSSSPSFGEVPACLWTNKDNFSKCQLCEEVFLLNTWNQALGLLWFEEGDEPTNGKTLYTGDGDDELLSELDGHLPWPSKRRRR